MFDIKSINTETPYRYQDNIFHFVPKENYFPHLIKNTKLQDLGPTSCVLPLKYSEYQDIIYKFKVRKDDVWIITFPKSGTTWMQEMVWLILNNFNIDKAKKTDVVVRSVFFEHTIINRNSSIQSKDTIKRAEIQPSPRIIKTHLPALFLPKELWTVKPKIIYIARNVKDVISSYYPFTQALNGHKWSKEEFIDRFLTDRLLYTPFYGHVLNFWNMRTEENILFLTYEQMKEDLKLVIKKVSTFLEVNIANDENLLEKLTSHLSFENMKKNTAVNHKFIDDLEEAKKTNFRFMRKGKVGSYKKDLSSECIQKIDEWIENNLKSSDYREQMD